VAVLREQDIQYLAERIALKMREDDMAQARLELEREHRRQEPGFQHKEDH
jgi:hypothetical protein